MVCVCVERWWILVFGFGVCVMRVGLGDCEGVAIIDGFVEFS